MLWVLVLVYRPLSTDSRPLPSRPQARINATLIFILIFFLCFSDEPEPHHTGDLTPDTRPRL